MARILVVGGYGGFGRRLCRRLADRGHSLIVAGRSLHKAQAYSDDLPRSSACAMDRTGDVAEVLGRVRPDLVIDAAGPFQNSGYEVPLACISAGIPYVDLADATDFVVGIGQLHNRAHDAGVAIVSGASSVPALTGAVARKLAAGVEAAESVELALSAANGATGGPSVIRAILSYVGRPVRLWRGRRWTTAYGWQELRRQDYPLQDGKGLYGRWVALGDVPDHQLLPPTLPGRPAVTFRAGTELSFHVIALAAASWLVRLRLLPSLVGASGVLTSAYQLTNGIGGQRSAMRIALKGRTPEGAIERNWTIVADQGQGAEIPTLAAELVAEEVLAGRCAPGATSAAELLSFDQFEPLLDKLPVCHEFTERFLSPPLYARVMGEGFERLPQAVRRLHRFWSDAGASGMGTVVRGRNVLARLLAAVMRMPPAGTGPLHVSFRARDGVETWTRDFGGHLFSSELSEASGGVSERFGAIRLRFALTGAADGLRMDLQGWSLFRVPLPLILAPRIQACEWEEEGRFRFQVGVRMPLVGEIVGYSGWLVPAADHDSEGHVEARAA